MTERVTAKCGSRKGASLAIALLLFLVCSVVGSVVLTAASASFGRLSGLAENDRRYYRIASAAELLESALCDKDVVIVRAESRSGITSTPYAVTIGENGEEHAAAGDAVTSQETVYTTRVNGEDFDGDVSNMSFLSARAAELLYGKLNLSRCNTAEAFDYTFSNADPDGGSFTLTHDGRDLDAEVRWTMGADGTLFFEIGDGGAAAADEFTLTLTLKPSVREEEKQSSGSDVRTSPAADGSGYTETLTETVIVTKTSAIRWSVGGIRKEAAG